MQTVPKTFIRLAALLLAADISTASAGLVFYAGTGHWYEAVKAPGGITWDDACLNAVQSGGYLCAIGDANENTFAASLVDASYYSDFSINNDILGPWLGGLRHANESNWQWVTNGNFTYSNWHPNQPDGYGGSEQRLQFYAGANVGSTWGDHPGTPLAGYSLPRGYIVEYDQLPRPQLAITGSNRLITVSWPQPYAGWMLATTPTISSHPMVWNQVSTNQYQTNATGFFITITNHDVGSAFYRLQQ